MFFEDEKDNLGNSDGLEDLELDLDEGIDDDSINWDELLKDDPDTASSVISDAQNAVLSEALVSSKPASSKKTAVKKQKKAAVQEPEIDEFSDLEIEEIPSDDDSKKDAFDVFGGEPDELEDVENSTEDDELLKELDAMEVSDELEADEDDDIPVAVSAKTPSFVNNIPALAGVVFAAVLVIGSLLFIFLGSNSSKQAAQTPSAPMMQEETDPDKSASEALLQGSANDENIPVLNEDKAKKLKPEKKIVLSVESAGRANPFLPTTVEFDKNLYSGIPAQSLMPPDAYGNDPDAQELMKVSVSGILFDNVKPSAIITINGVDYFVQKGDLVDDYRVLDINRQAVIVKKGSNIYKAGVGERFGQNYKISGAADYQSGDYAGARRYQSVGDSDYTSPSDVQINVRPQ